jgi:hypothetical protein
VGYYYRRNNRYIINQKTLFMEKVIGTLWEGSLLAGGAIAGAKWLDRNVFWASNIAADPNFINQFQYQHWGGIIAAGAAWGSTMVDNPYIKAGLVGLTVYGILEEARQLFGTTGNPPVMNWQMMGRHMAANPNEAALDAQLKALALQGANANAQAPMAAAIPGNYYAGVGNAMPPMAAAIPGNYYAGVGAMGPLGMGWPQ